MRKKACKNPWESCFEAFVDGHHCTYRKQWNEDKVNAAVEEVICKLVKNSKFEEQIRKKIGVSLDMQELDKEYENMNAQWKQFVGAKNKLAQQMDHLSVSDKHYDKKYQDM